MVTNKQRQARRENCQRSTGPKTPAGKAASSQNAVKWGFFTLSPVLNGESLAEFSEYRARFLASLDPVGGKEEELAEAIVGSGWRLRRFPFVENGLYATHLCDDQGDLLDEEASEMLNHRLQDSPDETLDPKRYRRILDQKAAARQAANAPENALGRAFLRDARGPSAFPKLSRYETAFSRRYHRDLRALERAQALRRGVENGILQNEVTEGLNALQ